MNFTLIYSNNSNDKWNKVGETYVLMQPIRAVIIDNNLHTYEIRLAVGYKCDGLSVPTIFYWYLPSWDKTNPTYNLAGIIHDALYTIGWKDNRELCDDVFRGILRDSGISRFKAGMADKCLEWFAGGDNHWKNDGYKNIECISIRE